jgi:hypothetical protein
MALARASDDPALKQRYEELALAFVQNAGNERDRQGQRVSRYYQTGNINPHGR